MYFQGLDIRAVIDDQLEEELVHRLEVRPGGVHEKLLLILLVESTSSMPTPSPGRPAFFKMGNGLKMFFSIMLMTRSKCGMMTVDMQVGSAKRSLNS